MCRHHQCSNLVSIVLRTQSYSGLDNCPTRVSLTWYSGWNCKTWSRCLSWCNVSNIHWCSAGCVVSVENKDLVFQVVRLNFVYVDLCFHRSAVGLWDHSHVRRFDDAAGHRFFWRLSSNLFDQLPDHVQQVERFRNLGGSLQLLDLTGNGGRSLHVPTVELVGESVPSFSCCLGGVQNLASDTCRKSLHRTVFVKLRNFSAPNRYSC